MPLSVRVCSADRSIRKYLPIDPEDTVGFFELIRRKFHIRDGEDLVLVDEQEGFGIDDDVLGDVVTSNPTVSLMVLKEDEEWSGSDVHSITSADTIKVDTSSSSLSSSESDSSFCSSRKRPRLNALSESGAITDNSCEFVQEILRHRGDAILREYELTGALQDKTRRQMINLLVAHMQEHYGKHPKAAMKTKYAMGIVNLFPRLKDPFTSTGHEAYFDARSNTGFLAARIKNVNRTTEEKTSNPLPKPSSRDGGPGKVREGDQESAPGCTYDEDLNWLRHCPTLERDSTLVVEKMKSTFPVRQHMDRDGRSASDILEQFPFETVPGLIEVDFRKLFPENHSRFLTKWPELKPKVVTLARQLLKQKGNLTVMELLSSYDSSDQNKEGWNSSTSAILLLLCLLPPASQGKSKAASAKVSISSALSRVIQFQKTGGSIQAFLDNTKETKSQPFLLAIGNSKARITNYMIIVDHKAIPCSARTVEAAVDLLFKTHFVFGLQYCLSLRQFWTFVQTAIFEIDIGVSRETPRVREIRSKLLAP
ncbi:uncharacterized protein LOC115927716 [Strongylocentrotus purpuratus]|uniref:Uncharacterized protein n=1 Tax=Strongylocentrotus purpuratus TaxID=7668 RepID=A0A7M7PG64_STRPU|nr:uncharacterized protein LOC115927716 [Strongylocentrotus purpuratus]